MPGAINPLSQASQAARNPLGQSQWENNISTVDMRISRFVAIVPAIIAATFATTATADDNDNDNNGDSQGYTDPIEPASPKRGLCYVQGEDPEDDRTWDHAESDLSWYYNFQANPIGGIDDKLQYVPMLWGEDSSDDLDGSFFDVVKGHIDSGRDIEYVLGFNEPDGCEGGGSCIDPDKAAEVWIDQIEPLKDLGLKLGAPAVTGSPRGLRWLQDFYTECDGGCKTDFLPIHWYGNFEGMAAYIGQVNETYQNMTMWVTEFNYPEQDLEETQAFFNQSVNHLDDLE